MAKIWRRIAVYSREKFDQLKAYQNAVELLSVSSLHITRMPVILFIAQKSTDYGLG